MEERGNYGAMGKASHTYTKEIRGGRGDQGSRVP
jgi:hypothetical protein